MSISAEWLEAFHIITVTMWMVGLFYLPRLMVYHAAVAVESDADYIFRVMERRLLYYIMTPSMIVSVTLGLVLALITGHVLSPWLHLKMIFVGILILLHLFFWRCFVAFYGGRNTYSSTFFRFINESVTFAFIAIIILAVIKPF